MKMQIRFDGPPGPVSGHFIEVEDENGRSIRAGKWMQDGPDWLLVIDTSELGEEIGRRPPTPAEMARAGKIITDIAEEFKGS